MRREFFKELYELMKVNPDVYALTADLGYKGFDKIAEEFPDRYLNCGASEATMLDIATGLAYSDKIPFVYTITPFFYRGWETIRTYIDHEKLNVKMVGSGRYDDYKHDGFSHNATDIKKHFDQLWNIKQFWPGNEKEIPLTIKEMIELKQPCFLSLKR